MSAADYALLRAGGMASPEERLAELRREVSRSERPRVSEYVNNHIHTCYSFSPYTPSSAVYAAWQAGLAAAGIMDHDSVAGAREFLSAGRIAGVGVTVGFECRCSLAGTPFDGMRLNNPDQLSVAYVACHGIPENRVDITDAWLAPRRAIREKRNRAMVDRLNEHLNNALLRLSYDADVRSISMVNEGGTVTERHILFALVRKLIGTYGRGVPLLYALAENHGVAASSDVARRLKNVSDPDYEYRLLGLLKTALVESFYINAADECPSVAEFVEFANGIGAIPAYPYLGDVGESVTGDKKAQAHEDAFLSELIPWIKSIGFTAISYMPTRNTLAQLERLTGLCESCGLLQISGEDINTPFQPFVCEELSLPQFRPLIDSAWALIGHESLSSRGCGIFSKEIIARMPKLADRIAFFAGHGRASAIS